MNDTICAISTSQGVGAISIVRVSGEEAINIVNKIFKGKDLTKVDSHTINYGHIVENDKVVEEIDDCVTHTSCCLSIYIQRVQRYEGRGREPPSSACRRRRAHPDHNYRAQSAT